LKTATKPYTIPLPTIMKKILIILILTFNFGFGQEKIDNPDNLFTNSEINDLDRIVNTFDKIIMNEFKTDSKKEAYLSFSEFAFNNNEFRIFKGFEELNAQLPYLKVFDEVWVKLNDKKWPNLNYNKDGKYLKYLMFLGQHSEIIKNYQERFKIINDIQPSVVGGIKKNMELFNYGNKNDRLFLTIHFFTLLNR